MNYLKLLFLLRCKHMNVGSHVHKCSILFSVCSTLKEITFGYFAHLGSLALLQLAMQTHG